MFPAGIVLPGERRLRGAMRYHHSVLDLVGHTPLVRLQKVNRGLRATILVKLEFMNPGGSVKDRIGLPMIEDAERRGLLKPGGTIVEPTSGNTGVGLAMAAALKGYRVVFIMPDKMSPEKVRLLKAFGADVVITPTAVEKESPESYYSVADRLSREIPGAFQPNQYYNPVNPESHYRTTGPEIWEQTDGQIDYFVCGLGTGGTVTGVARYLKERKPSVRIVGVDPEGSLYTGETVKPYKIEGIGEDFIPGTIDLSLIDEYVTVSDRDAFLMARRLAREEGLLAGGSSGAAVFGALKVARHLDESTVVVVLLPDTGRNYLSKFFSDDYMKEHGFWDYDTEMVTLQAVLQGKKSDIGGLIAVGPGDSVVTAIEIMQRHSISQLPVLEGDRILGSVQETRLMNLVFEEPDMLHQSVSEIMSDPLPAFAQDAPVTAAYEVLSEGRPAVLVMDRSEKPCGIVTKIDLLDFITRLSKNRDILGNRGGVS